MPTLHCAKCYEPYEVDDFVIARYVKRHVSALSHRCPACTAAASAHARRCVVAYYDAYMWFWRSNGREPRRMDGSKCEW